MDKQKKRERFLNAPLSIRLGNVAANLSRIDAFSDDAEHDAVVRKMIEETKAFCEWAGLASAEEDIKTAHTFLVLQRQLVRWDYALTEIFADPVRRAEMAETARAWSNHMLVLSGLLTQSKPEPSAA